MKNPLLRKPFIEGFVQNLSYDDYQNSPGLNQTTLKESLKNTTSWKRIKNAKEHQLRGHAGHCLILEPKRFQTSYIRGPEGLGQKGYYAKRSWVEFQRQNPGKIILPADLWDQLKEAHSILKVHPEINEWMLSGDPEISAFWFDDLNRIRCKARLDWYNVDLDIILDLKFTSYVSQSECKRRMVLHHYDLQAAWYCRAVNHLIGTKPQFVIVFIESSRPYRILPMRLSSEDIQRGGYKINQALNSFIVSGDFYAVN